MNTQYYLSFLILPLLLCSTSAAFEKPFLSIKQQNPDQVFQSSNPTANLSGTDEKYRRAAVYVLQETWERSDSYKYIKVKSKRLYKETFNRQQRNNIEFIFPFMQAIINREIRYKWEF